MDLPILILLAGLCVAIGFVLDNLLHSLREGKQEPAGSPKPTPAPARLPEPIPPAASEPLSLKEVLRIWRRTADRELVVEVNGKKADSPAGLNRDQLDQLGAALQELSAWLGQGVSPGRPEAPSGSLKVFPGGYPPSPGEALQVAVDNLTEVKRPSLNPVQLITNALRADIPKPGTGELRSLAIQVDEVLQEKLRGTPLELHGIKLVDGPNHDLLVQVGIQKYSGVEEVPDEEVRAIIREAVAEWRKRFLPGK
jgi:hypothetical protein